MKTNFGCHNMLCLERGEHTMKKTLSLLLTAIMVFSLVPALFVRDGWAADDKYVKNSTAAAINVYKEANDASQIVSTLPAGGVAKFVSSSGAFLKIENPAGYVKTSQVLLQSITVKAEGGVFLYDGLPHKVKVTLTNGTGFTVEFSTDGGKNWTTTVPGLTEPGNLKVNVRACKNSVIINHKQITLEVTQNPPEGTEITIVKHSGITKAPVRAGASTSAAKLGTVSEGQKYQMIAREGSWYKFKFGTKVGYVYYWYVKVGAFSSETDKEPDPSKAKLTAKGGTFVYDGKEHKVTATLENGDGYTIEYSTDGGKTWTKTAPGQTEVGKLTVKVRATGGSSQLTHKDVAVEVLEKIPAGTKITIVAHGSTTKAPVRSGTGSSAAKIGTALAGQTYPLLGRSGSWYKISFDGSIGFVYYWFVKEGALPDPETSETAPGPEPDITTAKLTAKGGTYMYDGLEHKVTYTLTNGTGLTVEFSTDGGKTWTTKAPGLTEPGKLTVKSRATGGKSVLNGNDVTLTVTNSAPVGTKITIVAHAGTTKAPVRAAASNSAAKIGSLAAGSTGTLQAVSGKWVKVKVGSLEGWVYEWFVKTGAIPVEDESGEVADPSKVKLTATGGTFVYDGKAHKVTAKLENGSGYTIEYSTDGGKNWSTAVPSLTEAGKLTVKVRATGGGNIITHGDVKLVITQGIPAGTEITIVAHGSQTAAPVRAAASSSGAKVGTVTAGQTGKLIKQEGVWYKVKVGDVEGYVYNWFVKVGAIVVDD